MQGFIYEWLDWIINERSTFSLAPLMGIDARQLKFRDREFVVTKEAYPNRSSTTGYFTVSSNR